MRTSTLFFASTFLSFVIFVGAAHAANPSSKKVGTKTYYKVTSTDTTMNTGTKVCALVDKTCIGYTNLSSNALCKAFNPRAKSLTSVSGSKAGFYCNGKPQKGICEKSLNTCHACPTCTVSANCSTDISGQFREMYIECGAPLVKSSSSKSSRKSSAKTPAKSSSKSSSQKSLSTPPKTEVGPYPGKLACDFYQTTKKKVTNCKSATVANNFCAVAMKSRLAKAVECKENGRIVCTIPCPKKGSTLLQKCAYDPERRSGYERVPYNFCAKS